MKWPKFRCVSYLFNLKNEFTSIILTGFTQKKRSIFTSIWINLCNELLVIFFVKSHVRQTKELLQRKSVGWFKVPLRKIFQGCRGKPSSPVDQFNPSKSDRDSSIPVDSRQIVTFRFFYSDLPQPCRLWRRTE